MSMCRPFLFFFLCFLMFEFLLIMLKTFVIYNT